MTNKLRSYSNKLCPVTGQPQRYSQSADGNLVIVHDSHSHVNEGWRYVGDASIGSPKYLRTWIADLAKIEHDHLSRIQQEVKESSISLASSVIRDKVYRVIFSMCTLREKHKRHLRNRALLQDYKQLEFGSMPDFRGRSSLSFVENIVETTGLLREDLLGVPGFYINRKGFLSFSCAPGLLLPIYDHKDRIIAMQVRRDRKLKDKGRYRFVSSGKGVSSGAPVGVLFGESECSGHVIVTEGYFKALTLRHFAAPGDVILYMPGVGSYAGVIERCKALGATSAEVVFDADLFKNASVIGALGRLLHALLENDLEVQVRYWHLKDGKGIDDYIKKGGDFEQTQLVSPEPFLRASRMIDDSDYLKTKVKGKRSYHPMLPKMEKIFQEHEQVSEEELRQLTKEVVEIALRSPLQTATLIQGSTGSGKSYQSAMLATEGTIIVVPNYKKAWETYRLLRELRPDLRVQIQFGRNGKPNEDDDADRLKRWEIAGCENFEEARQLGSKLHSPCHGCPLAPKANEETTCRHLKHRDELNSNGADILIMLPELFFSSELAQRWLGRGQAQLDGRAGYTTVIFDDIPDLHRQLGRLLAIKDHDLQDWFDRIPTEFVATRALLEKIAGVLFNPARSIRSLYHLAQDASEELQGIEELLRNPTKHTELGLDSDDAIISKALPLLIKSLLRGDLVRIAQDVRGQRQFEFVNPSPGMQRLQQCRTLILDATPDIEETQWFAQLLDLEFKAPPLPQRLPHIVQMFEKLWTRDQMDHFVIEAMKAHTQEHKSLTFGFKGMEDVDGWWGYHERGLNEFMGINPELCVMFGHYMKPSKVYEEKAFLVRALEKHYNKDLDLPKVGKKPKEGEEQRIWREYNDPWRPIQRKTFVHHDPLVEKFRQHDYTARILQMSSRSRRFDGTPHILFSGTPLELNGKSIPVELWSCDELIENLKLNVKWPPKRQAPLHIQKRNEKAHGDFEQRVQRGLELFRTIAKEGEKWTIRQLREFLAENGKRASMGVAKKVRALWEEEMSSLASARNLAREGEKEFEGDEKRQLTPELLETLTSLGIRPDFYHAKFENPFAREGDEDDLWATKETEEEESLWEEEWSDLEPELSDGIFVAFEDEISRE